LALLPIPDLETDWRYESKYRLNHQQYFQVKNAFVPYLQQDGYTKAAPSQKYLVRSLYFDTFDYQTYFEKLSGNYSRIKYRIRTYASSLDDNTKIRVELKVRQGEKTIKYGAFVSPSDFRTFMKTRHWHSANPALIEFERYTLTRLLQPKLLVEYRREGFRTRHPSRVRVTFDHQVHSAQSKLLFPQAPFFHKHNASLIVLEIKHRDQKPDWLKAIIQQHGLKIVANCKYCQSIDITQPNLVNLR